MGKLINCEMCGGPFAPDEDEQVCEECQENEQRGYSFDRPRSSRRWEGFDKEAE